MDFTTLLTAAASGDLRARAKVIEAAYEDLCVMAAGRLRSQQRHLGLTPSDLVHEIAIRLLRDPNFPSRDKKGFFGYVGKAMQNYLIDHTRRLRSRKRCGELGAYSLIEEKVTVSHDHDDLLSLHEAVRNLSEFDLRKARVVQLRFFEGRSIGEVAEALKISEATVKRDWESARCWLRDRLQG